ncbi:lamin tail domain-containing protein [Hymenobacter negativus]|uniref:Lamin tail domain-containing protein n=1 Tax=Hymenobacter negativus TaxID=2795026 RepID=A0ABS0QBI7_9BACT|nr:lamin tail domain-containing protein [Hymenobacter negativus]MBH8560039.1 lamin tail domain-containing protein [Hymenobacter negativus]
MLKHLYFLLLFLPGFAHAQLADNFTDGNFTANPTWTGDAASFQVNAQVLQSNGPAVTTTQVALSTPCQATTGTVWEFWANLKVVTTSGNYADVWLIASQADLKATNNSGYFVRLGGTGGKVSLFRKDSTRTAVAVIDGATGSLSTTNNLVRVRVTRTTANQWTLERDLAGNRTFVAEATQPIDATYQRSVAVGVFLNYSATNNRNFYFDDFVVTDATAPLLARAVPADARQVDVVFNEAVAAASAGLPANYRLQSGAVPVSAQPSATNPAVVRLVFAADFPSQSVLEVRNVADLYGNVAAGPLTAAFTALPVPPAFGDLIISEIFADETPQVGLPLSEYVEIYNRSLTKTLSLRGVRLGKTSTTTFAAFADTAKLLPGQYAIVCGSTRISQFATPGVKVYGPTNFPSLSNGGDQLILRGRDGRTLFEVTYSDTWYRDVVKKDGGWSLEMIDTNNFCAGASNWIASTDPLGGTPGRANSVRAANADAQAPALLRAELPATNTLRLTFSEKLDSASVSNVSRYTLAPANTITRVTPIGPDFRQVDLTLGTVVSTSAVISVTVQTASDCVGNVSGSLQTATVAPPVAPAVGDLIITEIFADETPPVGLPSAEYVEIYNRSLTKTISLRGVRLGKGSTATVAVLASADTARLAPGQYAIVCGSTHIADFATYGKVYGPTSFPSLSNGGDQLILRGADGRTLFEVTYSDAWYRDAKKKDGGWSLEMIDTNNYCGGAENWTASTNPIGGTPGKVNSVSAANADALAPTLLRAVALNSTTVRAYFSEKLDSATAVAVGRYALAAPGPAITRAAPVGPDFRQVDLTLAAPLSPSRPITLTVQTATDCAGNASGVLQPATLALPEPAVSGDVVINELLFNPRVSAVRFVEIINRSNKFIDLQGWQIGNVKSDASIDGDVLSTGPLPLAPGQILAFSTSTAIITAQYPSSSDAANLVQIPGLPSFPDAGTAVLIDGNKTEIDRLAYSKALHLSLLATQDGVSLERIRTNGPTLGSNFHSAASAVGYATPGRPNSQAQDDAGGNQELTVTPEVFTPDDDGQQDFATLNYHLDAPGYAASVTVYDALGRLTRRLTRNETLPINGFIQWDGIDDKGHKAAVGYYILLVELFRPTSGEKREFKKTVVLGARF